MRAKRFYLIILIVIVMVVLAAGVVYAASPAISITKDGVSIGGSDNPEDVSSSIQILLLLTVLSLAPSILIMMTSFTRIIIILSFLRNALGTQQMPPNQVMIGLALFLTLFIMTPIGTQINNEAFQPFTKGEITQQAAFDKSSQIIKGFMLKQIENYKNGKDLELFVSFAKIKGHVKPQDLPLTVVIPAFLISELKTAFWIGFIFFIPFLVIDMVVASTLMSMGMMMLPPVMISLPFKILLFIMADGWNLVAKQIMAGFG